MPTPWTTSLADLRAYVSDQGADRLRYRKKCMGRTNGVNATFQTLEFRRVSSLVGAVAPFGVYVSSGNTETQVTVSTDNPVVGEFTLSVAPANGSEVRATYYYQWFTDAELTTFLGYALAWATAGNDITQVDPGIQPGLLQYAAGLAYQKMAVRWAENWSMIYRLEDTPTKDMQEQTIKGYNDMAKMYADKAENDRKQFYSRQDLGEQPLFLFSPGRVRDPMPKR